MMHVYQFEDVSSALKAWHEETNRGRNAWLDTLEPETEDIQEITAVGGHPVTSQLFFVYVETLPTRARSAYAEQNGEEW
jgi:hypothetical protein